MSNLQQGPAKATTFNDPEKEVFLKHCGKGENASNQHFLIFPHVSYPPKTKFQFLSRIYFFVCKCFNPFPNKPWFLRVCITSLLKALQKIARNEQFLLFSAVLSTCFESFLPLSTNLKFSSANTFSLEESKICRLGKG